MKLFRVNDELRLHTFYETCMATKLVVHPVCEEQKDYVV